MLASLKKLAVSAFDGAKSSALNRNYEISEEELGRGRFSVVRKAIKKSNQQAVAVKEIFKGECSAEELDGIKNEISLMKKAKHPHCIELFEVVESSNEIYMVMELATGGELFDRITSKKHFSEKEAAFCFLQIIEAIGYLHKIGIAHRDLKPENILYLDQTPDSPIKVADFGLGKLVTRPWWQAIRSPSSAGSRPRMNSLCGSPLYVAPEVLSEQPEGYGMECDVWSAGVILYVMLSGTYPWSMDEGVEPMLEQVKTGKFEFPAEAFGRVSQDAKDLISEMLVLDPEKRNSPEGCTEHPWISKFKAGLLSDSHLPENQTRLRKFSTASYEPTAGPGPHL